MLSVHDFIPNSYASYNIVHEIDIRCTLCLVLIILTQKGYCERTINIVRINLFPIAYRCTCRCAEFSVLSAYLIKQAKPRAAELRFARSRICKNGLYAEKGLSSQRLTTPYLFPWYDIHRLDSCHHPFSSISGARTPLASSLKGTTHSLQYP